MRTSIDFPDPLFRSLKANAALQGMSLRDHVLQLIERGMHAPALLEANAATPRPVPSPPTIALKIKAWPKGFLTSNEQIYALLEQDDAQQIQRVIRQRKK